MCSISQADSQLIPNSRSSSFALTPLLLLVSIQIARNHVSSGSRVFSKIVPAVIEVCLPHAVQT